jgi:UTP--glucose-1-phosphate uridylyltransferase
VDRYGILEIESQTGEREFKVKRIVEKPNLEEAPSRLAAAGRYVLVPEIFEILDTVGPGKNNEIQLTDALQILAQQGRLHAYRFEGKRYDVGNKTDYVLTTLEFALEREDLPGIREAVEEILKGQ